MRKVSDKSERTAAEEDRGGVLGGCGLAVRWELGGIIMRAVLQGRGCNESLGVVGCGGRVGSLASHGGSIAKVNSIDK